MIFELPGLGKADHCQVSTMKQHRPTPLRFVWHHIQPQEAGGLTVAGNLIQVCDSCHYTIHRLMWQMAHELPHPPVHRDQLMYAGTGFGLCVAARTVSHIPNEG